MSLLKSIYKTAIIIVSVAWTSKTVFAVSCTVSSNGLAFGTYFYTATANVTSAANITVTCSNPVITGVTSYQIALSTGSSGNYTNRTMTNGISNMLYNIYLDPTRTIVWGNGTGTTQVYHGSMQLSLLSNSTQVIPAYGAIPIQTQGLTPGNYTDVGNVIMTITF